mgnify:CR=1 FL=1
MTALAELLVRIAGRVGEHESPIATELARTLRGVAEHPLRLPPTEVPLCRRLPALAEPSAEPLVADVLACKGRLHWRSRGAGKRPAALAARIASVEIVGPTGMIACDTLRFGLFLQDSLLDYPSHWHAAEELYLVLHGKARWTAGHGMPRLVPPGRFVHHLPWQPHRMTSGADPLLALWCWCGEIDYATYELL